MLRILMVGAGAVGGYLGGLWSAAGRDVMGWKIQVVAER